MCSFRGSYANRGSGTERASSDDVGADALGGPMEMLKTDNYSYCFFGLPVIKYQFVLKNQVFSQGSLLYG